MILPPHGHGAAYDPELAALMGTGSVDGHSLLPGDIPRLRELTGSWRPSAADFAVRGISADRLTTEALEDILRILDNPEARR